MKQRITYVVNHAAFFASHRLPVARAAKHVGYDVDLITGLSASPSMETAAEMELLEAGVPHTRVRFRTDRMNPFAEFVGFAQLCWHLLRRRPALVHCASPKGMLYGGIAARLCRVPALVLAISGMGYANTASREQSFTRTIARAVYRTLAGFAFGHGNLKVIVQNSNDRDTLLENRWVRDDQIELIPGSGVNLNSYAGASVEDKDPIVLFPARMLLDKGLQEFVEAARMLRVASNGWKFVLAGAADYQNPSCVGPETLRRWQAEGLVDWLGHVDNMVPLYSRASIVCLPSYREGMPKALLEAAAAGCAVVTTDTIGCRDAIIPGQTGDLVPLYDSSALAKALTRLMSDKNLVQRYGMAGKVLAADRYSLEEVIQRTLHIYSQLLSS